MTEPIATVFLILATSCFSIWAFEDAGIERKFIFCPKSILADKEYYRLVSSSFLHAGWGHLLLNMYTLYHFGGAIEWRFGPVHFLQIYFGSVMGGDLLSLYLHRHHEYAAYGASGGVCGLIFAYVLIHPGSRLVMFPLPYAVPAWLFAIAFVIASFYAMKSQQDNIGHDAHLGGAMIGLVLAAVLHPELVRQHWAVFLSLLAIGGLVFAFLLMNPLFLPVSTFVTLPSFRLRVTRPRTRKSGNSARPRPVPKKRVPVKPPPPRESDWLIDEIEVQVGKLAKDETGSHDWIDKFGRTYKLVVGSSETFDLDAFTKAVLDQLNCPKVNFVIVDTRQLRDDQLNLLKPFIADLPDRQFNRVLRSYAFKQRRRD